jgi:hypothetical protein
MKPVDRSELLDLGAYEQIRERFRRRIIEVKRARRVPLGSNMTVLFENHDTVLFQIQEMLRTERITSEAAVHHELETYNQLVPGANELSATIFIEYPEREERERMLVALAGVEGCFSFRVGEQRNAGVADKRGERTDRTTAVHYLKFPLAESAARALREANGPAVIAVDHPSYRAEVELGAATRQALAEDLLAN